MRTLRRALSAALAAPLLLSGCSIMPTHRHLPVPKAPPIVQTVTPAQLVAQVNQHWDALNTLTATVQIQATDTKAEEGLATSYPSIRGYIVLSKPRLLRVAGTYFGVKIFDMSSDGSHFTLVIPPKNLAIQGSNTVEEKSKNELENLRPGFFFNAIVVRGLDLDDEYMVSADTDTIEDPTHKHLYIEPEYVLTVMRHDTGSQQLMPVRQITFHRDDMLPYEQDLYDDKGNLETVITYSNYADFGTGGRYPSRVVIKRPLEGVQLVLTVIRVQENVKLPADEFEVKIPPGTPVKTLK